MTERSASPPAPRRFRAALERTLERPLAGPALVLLLGAAILAALAPALRAHDPDLLGFNDQVGYITTARWLADEGELRSHIVYPAFVESPRWRLYMPGHYAVLAATYKLLGAAPWVWILPSLAAYLLLGAGVFWIGRRLHGARAGALAAALVMLFPAVLHYAFTAMSELTFLAAAVGAFALFLALPDRARFATAPLLVALAFLFRETGALLVLPMALFALRRPAGRTGALAATVLGSALAVGAIYAWQVGTGKQSPPIAWMLHGYPNYANAQFEEAHGDISLGEIASGVAANVAGNSRLLFEDWTADLLERSDPALTLFLVLLVLATLTSGLRRARREPYTFGAGLLGLATLLILLFFHKTYAHVAIRHLLFPLPFAAVALAPRAEALLGRVGERLRPRRALRLALAAAIPALALLDYRWVLLRAEEAHKDYAARGIELVERIGHDDRLLLVHPRHFGLGYMLSHYPVRWSFVPVSDPTLRLLDARHPIGTLILEEEYLRFGWLTRETLTELGLVPAGSFEATGKEYLIFKRDPLRPRR